MTVTVKLYGATTPEVFKSFEDEVFSFQISGNSLRVFSTPSDGQARSRLVKTFNWRYVESACGNTARPRAQAEFE